MLYVGIFNYTVFHRQSMLVVQELFVYGELDDVPSSNHQKMPDVGGRTTDRFSPPAGYVR